MTSNQKPHLPPSFVILYALYSSPRVFSICLLSQPKLNSLESGLTHTADILARIASTERGLSLLLYDRNLVSAEGER